MPCGLLLLRGGNLHGLIRVVPPLALRDDGEALLRAAIHDFVDGGGVVLVMLREGLLDGVSRLLGVVVRDPGAEVVGDVGATDAMVEEVKDLGVGAVDGAEGALEPRPLVGFVVGDVDVGVLEPGVEDEPHVDEEVGTDVESGNRGATERLRGVDETGDGGEDADVGEPDLRAPVAREEGVGGDEVAGGAADGAAGCADEEVEGPAEDEVVKEVDDGEAVLADPAGEGEVCGPRGVGGLVGDVGLTFRHVVCAGVMDGVGPLPGEVGYEERGVEDEADGVLEGFVVAERVVTALVGDDPEARENGTLPEGVDGPEEDGEGGGVLEGCGGGEEEVGGGGGGGGQDEGDREVAEGFGVRLFEAALGDGAEDGRGVGEVVSDGERLAVALEERRREGGVGGSG
mmetsp:Transcript_28948/g.72747  ORF Transcript_28948/g.72747 Transcript_28948/m.72747 type:complete len:400 (-) Transcript_28948:73-1272(-)